MRRAIAALCVLGAMALANGCVTYAVRKVPGAMMIRDTSRSEGIVRVLTASGEIAVYPEKSPAAVRGGKIVQAEREAIPVSEARMIWIRQKDEGRSFLTQLASTLSILIGVPLGYVLLLFT